MRAQSSRHPLLRDHRRRVRRSAAARIGTPLLVVAGTLLGGGCDTPTGVEREGDAGQAAVYPTASHVAGPPEGVRLPWHMRYEVELAGDVVPPAPGCLVQHTVAIEGQATHLGQIAGTGTTCLTSAAPDPDPPFLPSGPPPCLRLDITNQWALTASNGDELWIEGHAVSVISLVDGTPRLEGTSEFIGGTGRFSNATGEVADVSVEGVATSTGWIHFRASDRAGS